MLPVGLDYDSCSDAASNLWNMDFQFVEKCPDQINVQFQEEFNKAKT